MTRSIIQSEQMLPIEEEDRVMQLHDPVFREWLAETMLRLGC